MLVNCSNESEWKQTRLMYLTASDAANYCGLNPYDDNGKLKLWEEKTGLKQRPDISGKEAVRFGKNAEQYLRELFLLMNPQYDCQYDQYGLWVCDKLPFMAATLDGLLVDRETGEVWILEIKTGKVRRISDMEGWQEGSIPIQYWCQECHQMICVPKAVGVITFALINVEGNPSQSYIFTVRNTRLGHEDDIAEVRDCATDMWNLIQTKTRPSVVLSI